MSDERVKYSVSPTAAPDEKVEVSVRKAMVDNLTHVHGDELASVLDPLLLAEADRIWESRPRPKKRRKKS